MKKLRSFNVFIDTASGLCINCPYSMYYDYTSGICRDCSGKCSFSCSYQKLCFQCPGTQSFDLDTMACVDSCDPSKVSVNNTQFQGIPICKSLDIYVDPTSTSIISLGTIDNPYKSLLIAFVEILNLHSHSNRTINVYVQTGTTLYVMPDSMYIINVSKVNLLTYTSTSSSTVRPKIYSVLSGVTLISPKTLFNIISNTTLNLNPQITNPILTSKEQTDLQTAFVGFMIDRCDFTIDGVDFITNQTQTNKTFTWIKAVYEQSKSVTLRNMNLVIDGNMFDSFDPLNLYLQNLNIDYYKSSRGFYLLTQCNYTNASLLNEISITNISVSNSIDRTRAQINSFLYISGNANFTMSNSSIDLFGSDIENFPQVYFGSSTGCIPSDGIKQYLTIQNTVFTLKQISNNTRFIQIYSNIDSGYLRSVTITLSGLTFNGLTMNTNPVVNLYANTKSMIVLNNSAIINSTFIKDIVDVYNSGSVAINNFTFRNISEFGESMILASSVNNFDINGLIVDNCTLSSTDNYYYFKHASTSGYTNITGLVFTNTDLKNRAAVYLSSVPSLTIKSSSITSSMIYPANSIIQSGSLSELNIDGFNFTQITSSVSGDNTNYLFSFDSFDLSKSTNFVMNKVMISQSVLAVFSFSKVVNPSSLSKTFTISNFQYTNSKFSDKNNLITFTKLEQSIYFSIMFANITFSSVSFNVSGNLLNFQQQLSNFTTVSGLTVTNTTNAQIYLQAANKQNTLLPVRVLFANLTTSNVKSGVNSFIIANDNTFVNITNSTVQTITSTGIGAAISVSTASALVNINKSTFSSNSATEAGAFYVLNSGIIRAYSSTFSNNNASISGLIKASNGGRFEFYSCTISSNTASEAPIAILFDSSYASILNNCVISNNTIGSNSGSNTFPIQLISSTILITNSTQISSQYSIISSFVSTIMIENSLLQNSNYNGSAIQVIGSTFNFNNMSLKNISQYQTQGGKGGQSNRNSPRYIISSTSTRMYISNATYTNSSLALFIAQQSTIIVNNVSSSSINSYGYARLENSLNATLSNWNINSNINNDTIYILNSYVYLMSSITITGINGIGFHSVSSQIDQINSLNCTGISSTVVSFEDSVIPIFTSSYFSSNGKTSNNNQNNNQNNRNQNSRSTNGIVYVLSSNTTISNSTFLNNTCTNGGALYYSCPGSDYCVNYVNSVIFSGNTASKTGGAIYYDVFRPIMTKLIFQNNSAPYGNDIASYPVRIVAQEDDDIQISLSGIASGQIMINSLVLNVIDFDNQTVTNLIKGNIVVSTIDQNTKASGRNSESIVNGVSTFSGLVLSAKPGSNNVQFSVNTAIIDISVISRQFGVNSIQYPIQANFRYCMPGEMDSGSECTVCTEGSYSLNWNSTRCNSCPNYATCNGGTNIWVDSGYFRSSLNSSFITPCIYAGACLGEYHPENAYPVKCNEGYDGLLCAKCTMNSTDRYEKDSNFQCNKCPNALYNVLRIIGLILLVSLFFVIMIVVGIRKKRESQQSILLRIMANYLQLLTAAMSFNLKFPASLSDVLFPAEKIGTSTEAFMSFDCFLKDSSAITTTPNIGMFKVLLTGLLPIFLILLGLAFWSITYLIPTKLFKDFKRNMCITIIVILYLLHPMLTKVGLEMFQCIKVDENKFSARINIDFGCFSADHLKWCTFLGVPIILFWSIGIPAVAFYALFKKRNSLNDPNVQRYTLMLYQGLKEKVFYWELVNTTRKILMIGINALLSTLPLIYSAISAVLVLIGLMRVQLRLQPYKQEINNKLEMEAMTTGTATLFCGVLFVSDSNSFVAITTAILVVIIVMNSRFFILWFLCMIHTFIERHELFNSIFNIIAISTFNKSFAEEIRREFSIKSEPNESVPASQKREIIFKSHKSKPKHKKKEKFLNRKLAQNKKGQKKKHSEEKGIVEEIKEEKNATTTNRIESTSHKITVFKDLDSTNQERESKDRMQSVFTNKKRRTSSKLCIIEEVFNDKYQNKIEGSVSDSRNSFNLGNIDNAEQRLKDLKLFKISMK